MQVVAHINISPKDILTNHGLEEGGKVQMFIDNECIRLMDDYTPDLNGMLKRSVRINTVIGTGRLITATPYARYQYYGMLMVDPITGKGSFYDPKTGRHWSRPNTPKVMDPNGRELSYNTTKSPRAGSHWFERMVADHKDDIGRGAAAVAGGKYIG